MGWGDWTVAAAVRPANVESVKAQLRAIKVPATVIGEFAAGETEVILETRSSKLPLARFGIRTFCDQFLVHKGNRRISKALE